MDVSEVSVRPVERAQEARYQDLMAQAHYLGALPKIGETLWYVASFRGEWVALCGFSAAAWKCTVRDRWIGWDFRLQFDRLKLIAEQQPLSDPASNGTGPTWARACSVWWRGALERTGNGGSRIPCGCWRPLWIRNALRARCTARRTGPRSGSRGDFVAPAKAIAPQAQRPKRVFTYPLVGDARARLCGPLPPSFHRSGAPKMRMSAEHMRALPDFFCLIPDPRRAQGRRHRLPTVLAIAAGAILCGMRGYKAIADWAQSLGPKALARFGCRRDDHGHYLVPSESIIRDVLIRVDPQALDRALQQWNAAFGQNDESLAIDGKTMRNAIDQQGEQTHVMSVVGHESKHLLHPKKVGTLPVEGSDEQKRTNEIGMVIPLLEAIEVSGRDITADALHTQRKLATYLVEQRQAHYHFSVKGNQPTLQADIELLFRDRGQAHFSQTTSCEHGRIETRRIWCEQRAQRALGFPPCGASVPHRTRTHREENRANQPRDRPRYHQPHPRAGQP